MLIRQCVIDSAMNDPIMISVIGQPIIATMTIASRMSHLDAWQHCDAIDSIEPRAIIGA